jgi:hypothetical protein
MHASCPILQDGWELPFVLKRQNIQRNALVQCEASDALRWVLDSPVAQVGSQRVALRKGANHFRRGLLADRVATRKEAAGLAHRLHHHAVVGDHGANSVGVRAHRITDDGVGPGARGAAFQDRVIRVRYRCQIAATNGSRWTMRGQLAFDACFVVADAATGLAVVRSRRASDAFELRCGVRLMVVTARALDANRTCRTATRDITHDRLAAARR